MALWLGVATVLLVVQAGEGSVAGVVTDGENGAPLPGATVSLVDLDRVAVTDTAGRYRLSQLPAGARQIVVGRTHYQPQTFQALVPAQGTLEINVALSPQPFPLKTIEVRALIPVAGLEADAENRDDFPDRGLSIEAVRQHPLLAEPDVLQATAGGEVALDPESPSGLHVRGGSSDQIAYLLDGIPVFSPYHSAGTFSAWNPDALSCIDLRSSSPSPADPDALSGVMSGTTLSPAPHHRTRGGVSTTQARVTADGPLARGAGYLASLRSAFPGLMFRKSEPSYLNGESNDWVGKLEFPAAAGRLRLLTYGSSNEIGSAAVAELADSVRGFLQNAFNWNTRSLGAGWTGPVRNATLDLRVWSATLDAGSTWIRPDSTSQRLGASRSDAGVLAAVELGGHGARTAAGIRAQWSRSAYSVRPLDGDGDFSRFSTETPVTSGFAQHRRHLTPAIELEMTLVGSAAEGRMYFGPAARLRWRATDRWRLSTGYSRRHQFAQSLRNPESLVGGIFPVDLYVGAGSDGVPVAHSDLVVASAEYHPSTTVRLGAQAYARSSGSLALVAPSTAEPFATGGFVTGSGSAYGLALEAAAAGTWYGVVGSYGLQRVRLEYGDTSYIPEHGVAHSIDLGFTLLPSSSSSIRLGVSGLIGRHTTAFDGALEWQSCNLLDKGCEFAGSPAARSEPLGASTLPAYFRVDIGYRKQWPLQFAGRQGVVALFGTVTNLLSRRNLLTYAVDPTSGERSPIEMRPLSPLVVGLDWRF